MSEFYAGRDVKKIFWPNEGELSIDMPHVDQMTVSMEPGQMSGVPWVKVFFRDVNKDVPEKMVMYNAAEFEGVEFEERKG